MATSQTTLELSISGMSCGSCVRHVGDALRQLDGIAQVSVDLAAGRARVAYHPEATTPDRMIGAIEHAGYHARLASSSGAGT